MADVLRFSVPGKPEYVQTVRMAVSCFASCAGFDVEAVEDIKVALSEVCNSMICPGESNPGIYEVACELDAGNLIISVEDRGEQGDPKIYRESCGGFSENVGLGLYILRTLMDEVNILSSSRVGTRITMVKYNR